MKFYEKLNKKRKEQNLSQEQLADKLGVSRQAVSKWESGNSYPDMEKILEMCKILNCTLDELLDDGVINKDKVNNDNKNLNYLDIFLKQISKIYNMFVAMTFKQKVKCIFELFVVASILTIISIIINSFVSGIIYNTAYYFDNSFIYSLVNIIRNILSIFLFVISTIITYHIFKVRYLNYYVTIEDSNVKNKVIEKEIVEKEKEVIKEKVIIRDPKDSNNNFYELLGKVFNFILICFISIFFIPFVFTLIGFIASSVISLYHMQYNIVFLYIALIILGLAIINYIIVNGFIHLLFKRKNNFKLNLILFISSIIIIAVSSSLTGIAFLNMEYTHEEYEDYKVYTDSKNYELDEIEYLIVEEYYTMYNAVEYNLEYTEGDVLIEVSSRQDIKLPDNNFNIWQIHNHDYDSTMYYDLFIKYIKDNKIITNMYELDLVTITVNISEENYNKLKEANNY